MRRAGRTVWNTQLQRGFEREGQDGMSVRDFLLECMGFDDCFIEETVRTVFLNSSPVDDIDAAKLKDGDKIALGSAMPGLIGICMGRDNPYKEFRRDIACTGSEAMKRVAEPIFLHVKVFSSLAVDAGEDVLKCGVVLRWFELQSMLEAMPDNVVDCLPPLESTSLQIDERALVKVRFES